MTKCRACGESLEAFMSFGLMPIANGFVQPNQKADDTYRFELAPAVCASCSLFQLMEQPQADMMFHGDYAFFSQTSSRMAKHFEALAQSVMGSWLEGKTDPFVVELGSNDGITLKHFATRGVRHLGVEPSANVAAAAKQHGVSTMVAFFKEDTAARIQEEHGQADVIMAANVMCHIEDINSVAMGIDRLLKPDGVLIFEDPYLGDVLQKTSFDQIYDEHVFLFSLTSVAAIFASHNLELIDALPQVTHGGSMRYVLARPGVRSKTQAVEALQTAEDSAALKEATTYLGFKNKCENIRDALVAVLTDLKKAGHTIAGYGATSKSTTVLNYCGIGPELISYISDTTPTKQGKLTPGSHIPVEPYETFVADYPDYAVLFAWNHADEIIEKEQDFIEQGGRFIQFFPTVTIVGPD